MTSIIATKPLTVDKTTANFSKLLSSEKASELLTVLNHLVLNESYKPYSNSKDNNSLGLKDLSVLTDEYRATETLIQLFNSLFAHQQVQLVRGEHEPEYFPADSSNPARIEFAHGFFASALHELSHWCLAGKARRQLSDFGYWYAADGRSEAQQRAFERVEIKPQALECLFTLACKRPFQVSQDNLFADFDTSNSTFASDVYKQAKAYIVEPQSLPCDAQLLLQALLNSSINNGLNNK